MGRVRMGGAADGSPKSCMAARGGSGAAGDRVRGREAAREAQSGTGGGNYPSGAEQAAREAVTRPPRRSWASRVTEVAREAARDARAARSRGGAAAVGGAVLAVLSGVWRAVRLTLRAAWRGLLYVFIAIAALLAVALLALGALAVASMGDAGSVRDYKAVPMPQDATIYDRDGEVIGVIATSSREPVAFGDISQPVKDAIVAIEDERFYDHPGVDPVGIARSVYSNFRAWTGSDSGMQGGSTITQQYVRNAFKDVGTERTVARKLREMMVSVEVESTMSKDSILDAYLNTVYYGNGQYGVQAASRYYFGHDVSECTPYEAAVLAAIVNAPSIYDPATPEGREATARRAGIVLDKMWSLGKLPVSQDELRELKRTDISQVIHITPRERPINQPFYYDFVMAELRRSYTDDQIVSGGWQIHTTLSIRDGEAARDAVAAIESRLGHAGVTSAIADVNVSDGSVNAFCGGTDYAASQFDAATMGRPQTGSTLKPFLYAAMMEGRGYYATDELSHEPVDVAAPGEPEHVIGSYIPEGGDASIRNGIIQSDNAMAVRAAMEIGMPAVGDMLHASGVEHDVEDKPIAVIGGQTQGLAPMELAEAYSTIASGGMGRRIWCVRSITDSLGNMVFEHEGDGTRAMSREVAAQLTEAMHAAVEERPAYYDIPFARQGWYVAAKTGTTDDKADLWCCGFDTEHAVAVWIGGRDARVDVPASTPLACREFSDYMLAAHSDDPKEPFPAPAYRTEVPEPREGETATAFAARLRGLRLEPRLRFVRPTDSRPDGTIVSVSDAGGLVDRGSAVTVTVAREGLDVPDFVGMTPEEAFDAGEGMDVSFAVDYSSSGPSTPRVTAQSVAAGTAVEKGTPVTLTITLVTQQGQSTVEQVPYKGSDDEVERLKARISELEGENRRLEDAARAEASRKPEASSTERPEAAEVRVPDVTGRTAADARRTLESLGLRTRSIGATSSGSKVTSTSPAAGERVPRGTVVTLRCSGDD